MLENLKPKKVWKYFEEICAIPHGSFNEKAISDYCVKFAKDRNLEVHQDSANNVIIKKKASKGYEKKEPIMLQGHLDMVCEKKSGSTFDFTKDGIEVMIDGDYVTAKDTTLGADDGIAVAFGLAILDDDSIAHPPLEVIFTTSEEIGLEGATALNASILKGHTLLNLDSEEEGSFTVGCAGGCTMDLKKDLDRVTKEGIIVDISVNGLKGGHSGVEINKGLGNANIILARALLKLKEATSFNIISWYGGTKDNAIPRESTASILVKDTNINVLDHLNEEFKKEYANTDPDITISYTMKDKGRVKVLRAGDTTNILTFVATLPNDVQAMSQNTKGLVETSCNLGILKAEESIYLCTAVRSELATKKVALREKIKYLADYFGYSTFVRGDYPAWEYRQESPLRDTMVKVYEEMFNKTPNIVTYHAGLECGILADKIENMDCVSIGPNLYDVHTYSERVSIQSVERTYAFVLELLKTL